MIYGGLFDLDNKIKRLEIVKERMNDVDFWNSSDKEEIIKGIGFFFSIYKSTLLKANNINGIYITNIICL